MARQFSREGVKVVTRHSGSLSVRSEERKTAHIRVRYLAGLIGHCITKSNGSRQLLCGSVCIPKRLIARGEV